VTTFTNILMCVLGVFFMMGAFTIPGLGKRPPYYPVTRTGRVLIFLIGLVLLVGGIDRLLSYHALGALQ
jgi:hypothetical protein